MKELALDTVQLDLFLKNLNVNFFFSNSKSYTCDFRLFRIKGKKIPMTEVATVNVLVKEGFH